MLYLINASVLFSIIFIATSHAQMEPSCDSPIYCQGDLLHTIQLAHLYQDSKTFVDMKIRHSVNETLENFEKLMNETDDKPSMELLKKFLNENFVNDDPFEKWQPPDFVNEPKFLKKIDNTIIRDFARNLIEIWPNLTKKMRTDIFANSELHSLIPVTNGFTIPGGRFKEFYYWDSYWIIKGLLISEMSQTVKGILNNFIEMIKNYGFIPNGARIYYLNRSQPPLFIQMVDDYLEKTNDMEWLMDNIKWLETEMFYWLEKKLIKFTKNGTIYQLAHYDVESGTPRPESYREDWLNAQYYDNLHDQMELYANLKSGAESGWDFSSRWLFDQQNGVDTNLTFINTRRVIPVDLNAILYKNFRLLSKFFRKLKNLRRSSYWLNKSKLWLYNIEKIFYNHTEGIWFDYDHFIESHRIYFYPSNFAPLWTEAYPSDKIELFGKNAVLYLKNQDILDYMGGIPSSLTNSGQQWDYPNAWAPLQSIVVFGLERTGLDEARMLARTLALRWINANWIGFMDNGMMYEKYDALQPGKYGGGGEYVVQSGFGMTNGVVLDFIYYYFVGTNLTVS